MTVNVLLADDDRLVRAGLRTIIDLEPDLHVVAEADDGAHAVAAARAHDVDVVLMDVRMPGVDGIEATRELTRQGGRAVHVLVLTTFDDDDDYVYDALAAGAGGFILKRANPHDLLAAIRVVARGEILVLPAPTRHLIERRRPARQPTLPNPLSDREDQVLRLLAEGRSNGEIARHLYLGTETVKTHVARLLAKIGARDRVRRWSGPMRTVSYGLVTAHSGTTSSGHTTQHSEVG